MHDYWLRQDKEPLFPDLLWSRPENKRAAGKLLIIGGNLHGFNGVASSYTAALKSGAGSIRLVLPDALYKLLSIVIPDAVFAPSTSSGSFSQEAYGLILENLAWADAVLFAGEFGKNSETTILLEKLFSKLTIPSVLAGDTIDNLLYTPETIRKTNTLISCNFNQLQKLAIKVKYPRAFTSSMSVLNFASQLHEFSESQGFNVLTYFENKTFISVKNRLSSQSEILNKQESAANAAVWLMQNPDKMFEAVTTSQLENIY